MTMSINGKITKDQDDTDWVGDADVERMDNLMRECGVMMMGLRTFERFEGDYPNDEALLVVLTCQPKYLKTEIENVIFTDDTPMEVLGMLAKKGYSQVMLAGGSKLGTSMLRDDLIDEIRLMVNPLVIGHGKPLFGDINLVRQFKLRSVHELEEGIVELIYEKINC